MVEKRNIEENKKREGVSVKRVVGRGCVNMWWGKLRREKKMGLMTCDFCTCFEGKIIILKKKKKKKGVRGQILPQN